jgi:hypothetical protein
MMWELVILILCGLLLVTAFFRWWEAEPPNDPMLKHIQSWEQDEFGHFRDETNYDELLEEIEVNQQSTFYTKGLIINERYTLHFKTKILEDTIDNKFYFLEQPDKVLCSPPWSEIPEDVRFMINQLVYDEYI